MESPAAESHPRLVVVIIVDQLSSWTFSRDEPLMRRGIRTLIDGGIYFHSARLPYASTYTAPGHATIGTGAPPAVTGIISNSWYQREQDRSMSAVEDPTMPVLHIAGATMGSTHGVSSRRLRVAGVADVLRRVTHGRGRSVSISLKDRGAAFALGQRPDVAVWYEPSQAAMTTSRAYAKTPPAWLTRLARDKPASRFFDRTWRATDPALLARHTGVPDERPGEGAEYELGTTFPHRLAATKPPARAIRATPFGTELVMDTAIAAVDGEKLGLDDVPDVLAISISSHDYAGHAWGPGSWERLDLLLQLDASVARLLAHLDRAVGKNRYAVVFTSDHGSTPLVESSRARGKAARRIPASELEAAAQSAARSVVGDGRWIQAISASAVYVSPTVPTDKRDAVMEAIATALRAVPGIAYARPSARIAGKCDERTGLDAMVCRSIFPSESGDVYFVTKRYHVVTTTYHTGTSHGSPHPEDTDVPVIVYSPGARLGHHERRCATERVSMLQIAPTVSALLGIPPPPAATARALFAPRTARPTR